MEIKEKRKKAAVILSAFNGEKYIREQLKSISGQDYDNFSVYIVDDCSTDLTYQIVADYISDNRIENWELERNEENLGWKKSFIKLLSRCNEEYVFLCDQDDYWHPQKVSTLVRLMDSHNEIQLLSSGYTVFSDNQGIHKPYPEFMKHSHKLTRIDRKCNLLRIDYPGCTYCVRSAFVKKILPFWKEYVPHDALLWIYAYLSERLFVYDCPLTYWRQHNDSAMGGKSRHSTKQERVDYIMNNKEYLEYIKTLDYPMNQKMSSLVDSYIEWFRHRELFVINRRMRSGCSLIKYIRYYPTLANYFGDYIHFCSMHAN